jgi:hypothetical protein
MTAMKTNLAHLVPPPESQALVLDDGATATSDGRALELRDRDGRLLIRYANGSAEIAAPAGDLVLSAPGRVVVRSGLDVEIEGARDVVQRAGRNAELDAGRVHVRTGEAEIDAGVVRTVARAIATKAERIALEAERYELAAERLVEKSRDAFREVADLAETRVGRARTLVATVFSLSSKRTVLKSEEDTSVDGRKILLG